jgi:hypothetical protein
MFPFLFAVSSWLMWTHSEQHHKHDIFVCVGVMYSGEYDVCDVTLSVHASHTGPRWESNPRPLGY